MSRWIWIAIGGVAIAALAFFGGVFVGRLTGTTSGGGGFRQGVGQNGANGGANALRSGSTSGTVVTISADGMTVKTSDGSTKNVVFSGTTSMVKSDKITATDIKVGDKVSTFGEAGSGGTITARIVSVGDANPFGGLGRLGQPGGGQGGAGGQNNQNNQNNQGGQGTQGGGFGGPPPGAP
jgi:hypothetical protein